MKLTAFAVLAGVVAMVLIGLNLWLRHLPPAAPALSPTPVDSIPAAPKAPPVAAPSKSVAAPQRRSGQPSADEMGEIEKELANPNGKFFDPVYRIMVKIPDGWSVRTAPHWGNKESTVFLSDPDHPRAAPSIYHREFDQPNNLSAADADAAMRQQAAAKAAQRVAGGLTDYANGEMETRTIADRPALTWTADFTRNGEPWSEYLTRVYSPNGTTLFFLMAPKSAIAAMVPQFEQTITATVVP